MRIIALMLASSFTITACGQTTPSDSSTIKIDKKENKMDLSKISNKNVRLAIDALQANDKKTWYSHFAEDATFTDDGRVLDFKSFFDNAFDKKERFLSIDKVEAEGRNLVGNFFAGQWGTFVVYFKFHENVDGKFTRLDIGQVSKL